MANKVFANGNEVSCKAAKGMTIAALPDVCFTPPENPATPPGVPIPYPNTGKASDTTKGTKTVKISDKEVGMKNKSYFKTSYGDEAGCAAKKGVITSKNKGKVYFQAWSSDVKFEGQNAVRHFDITTNNHMSNPGDTPPWAYIDRMAFINSDGAVCEEEKKKAEDKCKNAKPRPKKKTAKGNYVDDGLDCSAACKKAKACVLSPKKDDKKACCHADTTGHHLIEVHCFSPTGDRGGALEDLEKYNQNQAPCVCASESRADGTHGVMHAVQGQMEGAYNDSGNVLCEWLDAGKKLPGSTKRANAQSKWAYKDARNTGMLAHKTAFPHCNAVCIKKQLDEYHKKKCGLKENSPLRSDPGADARSSGSLTTAQQKNLTAMTDSIRGIGSGTGL